ncbi:thymidine phosphorylase [Armatimonas sp.]|uniref:thymidine phosphorylase n=1 Tax=Armatimonas sp. TaxID=1872638 RepID=UPI00286A9691|nr:thymidine phosphorylase [Armatimonas sp.]
MHIPEIIAKKRDGGALTAAEITFFVDGYTTGAVPDYQAAALLMAIYLQGMDGAETATLTAAMAGSGQQLDLSDLPHALDKHSTGGVGDKTSLIVVPILAAAGVPVCKMSGRGLGHTGGTLDKLEAISGLSVALSPEQMLAQVHSVGACLAGQTETLAPADKKLYALRDATATVACLPLIVSSILSKKLAGGAPSFLFDVKVGSGALMKTQADALALAEALVAGSIANGRRATALVTDMSQSLGRTIGNALEVNEALELLENPASAEPRLLELCLRLSAEGISLAQGSSVEAGREQAETVLKSGAARDKFLAIIAAQGGNLAQCLPEAPIVVPVTAPIAGTIQAMETQALGELVVRLGGGRATKEAHIDPAVGLVLQVTVGQRVEAGQVLAFVHARAPEAVEQAIAATLAAILITPAPREAPSLIHQIVKIRV